MSCGIASLFFLCWARVSVGMEKGSLLSFSNFFDIVDLNRDVEASMEFFYGWDGKRFSLAFFELF